MIDSYYEEEPIEEKEPVVDPIKTWLIEHYDSATAEIWYNISWRFREANTLDYLIVAPQDLVHFKGNYINEWDITLASIRNLIKAGFIEVLTWDGKFRNARIRVNDPRQVLDV